MKKKPTITKKQVKKYFKLLKEVEDNFHKQIVIIDSIMANETGIEDIEFIFVDGAVAGIGNASRTMPLINRI